MMFDRFHIPTDVVVNTKRHKAFQKLDEYIGALSENQNHKQL